jgi:dUTP pyrophosphatase
MSEMFNQIVNSFRNQSKDYSILKLAVDSSNQELFDMYTNACKSHNESMIYEKYQNSGFDLFFPEETVVEGDFKLNMVSMGVKCEMINPSGYSCAFYMYPRSSITKSPFRLANNVGIIDAGYRGHLIGMFDLPGGQTEHIKKFDRYLQICAPQLVPIFVELVASKQDLGEKTDRGEGGFGSTSTF